MGASKLQALWNHPAGPKTSEFSLLNPMPNEIQLSLFFLFFFWAIKQEIIEADNFFLGILGPGGYS